MLDGAELAMALVAHPDDVEAALSVYEQAMFRLSEAEAKDAHVLLELCLGDRAPFGFVDFLNGAIEKETELRALC